MTFHRPNHFVFGFVAFLAAASAQSQENSAVLPDTQRIGETILAEDNGATNETGNKRNETDTASLAADLELKAYVDGLLATWQFAYGGPGHTVAVVRPDRNVLTKGYGLADVERGTPVDASSTRFHVASISKTFVWTAAMMLVDRGSLDLNADVNTYLKRYKAPAGERPLTLHDLMSHRAGVEENLDLFSVEVAEMERSEALAATEPEQVFARGTRAAYSNWGSNLVALIIEDATGRDYAEFLSTEILQPLGMSTTALTDESPAAMDPSTPVAKNYWVSASGPQERAQLDLGSFAPIGGMTTTAADMARWMRFHLNRGELDGVRLISEEGYATLRSRAFDPMPGAAGRASGFADIPFRSVVSYGHTGSINEFLSKFAIAPELGLGVFIAQNSSNHFDPLDSVPSLVFDRALAMRGENIPVALVTDAKPEDIEAAEEVAGRYMTSRRVFSGPLKILAAMDGVMKLSAQDGLLVGRHPSAPFARIAPDLWENRFGQRLAFVRGEDGSVEHVITPAGASDAVPVDWRSDPMLLGIAFGATALFSLTTWLGFWRRFRQQHETRRTGTLLSATALLATLPVVWMIVLATQVPGPDELAFADVFSDWPIPFLGQLALSATVVAGTAIILTVCLVPAWARSGWNVARRLHFTLFAMAYATLAVFLAIWGLVPYSAG